MSNVYMIRGKQLKIGDILLVRRGTAPFYKNTEREIRKINDEGNYLDVYFIGTNDTYTVWKDQAVTVRRETDGQ